MAGLNFRKKLAKKYTELQILLLGDVRTCEQRGSR